MISALVENDKKVYYSQAGSVPDRPELSEKIEELFSSHVVAISWLETQLNAIAADQNGGGELGDWETRHT